MLAELKGKAGDQEKGLVAALEKTMTKIVKHQTDAGDFAGNGGWAPVLSVAIANKSVARAKQNGVAVDERVFQRALAQSQASAAGKPLAAAPVAGKGDLMARGGAGKCGSRRADSGALAEGLVEVLAEGSAAVLAASEAVSAGGIGGGGLGGSVGDAGVSLYRVGQGAGNLGDVVNSMKIDGAAARQVLKDAKASKSEREEAQKKLDDLKKAETENAKVQDELAKNVRNDAFVAGFGSNGGEEFLSFLNISETLILKGGKDWEDWDAKMTKGLEKAQDPNGSWQGHHCITGRTFCTAGALLVLMADRTQFPPEVLAKAEPRK